MTDVYVIRGSREPLAMNRVFCKDESEELQSILERTPDLLPGSQIDPDDPRRWILIKREMPVSSPKTGVTQWSVDFLFADQDAMPTFVECKRFKDTRARREVVGQMLEYAANGPYYWSKETLRDFADKSAAKVGRQLGDLIVELNAATGDSVDAFFDRLHENLREGQLRIVFFLENSAMELRSIVDFLNRQMERSEVLLVEARQYDAGNGDRIVVPMLFGYTEQARLVKRLVNVTSSSARRLWDLDSFLQEANKQLEPSDVEILRKLYEALIEIGFELSWGTGAITGSFNAKRESIAPLAILSVTSNGRLVLNIDSLKGNEAAERARATLRKLVEDELGIPLSAGSKFPSCKIEDFGPKISELIAGLSQWIGRMEAGVGTP